MDINKKFLEYIKENNFTFVRCINPDNFEPMLKFIGDDEAHDFTYKLSDSTICLNGSLYVKAEKSILDIIEMTEDLTSYRSGYSTWSEKSNGFLNISKHNE